MWRQEAIPQRFNDVAIIHPYILKGNAQIRDRHRDISLLYYLLPGRYWPNPTDSPAWISWSGWNTTSKSVWIAESQKADKYYLFSQAFPTEISNTKYGPQHDLCRQLQSFWHSQPWWALENDTTFSCPARFIAIVRQFIELCLHDSRTIESTLDCFLY